jgi:coenzyme F420-reducing hydrogenase beta subunit
METDEANFRAFYKERRREKYLREEAQLAGGVISLNAIDSDELDGVGVVADTSERLMKRLCVRL